MTIRNKIFYLDSQFTKELPSADEPIDSIFISGYASVNVPDRSGDIIPATVWEAGIQNYLKNPIVLAFHEHDDPVGRVVEHKIDEKGLWVKARISAAAEVFNLVKDGVITAFSVGFRIKDAEYKPEVDLFIIKELELLEISVVSVPCNQDTLFSLSKSFDDDNQYNEFKQQFTSKSEAAKESVPSKEEKSITKKEIGMDPKELEKMLADAAEKAAIAATEALVRKQAEEAAAKAKAEQEAREMDERIQKALEKVTPSVTGGEKLLAEIEKRVSEAEDRQKEALAGLEAEIRAKKEELEQIQRSRMTFAEKRDPSEISIEEKTYAVILSKVTGKSIENTKYGKDLVTKALGAGAATGAHLPSQTWEHEVSLNMEDEMRRRLVVAPLFRTIQMQTNVMSVPVNPEAGEGTWIQNSEFGTTASPGASTTHQLKEITLNAYKLATREYLNYEEEEDSLIVLLPIVRDAMIRRTARSVEKSLLVGTATTASPVKGVAVYDATSAVTLTNTGTVTVATLRALRKDLGDWGLEPSDLVYVVSNDVYYDLLEDTTFMTMDKVGDRATILTGQMGMVGGIPVLVSPMLHNKTTGTNQTNTNIGAVCLAAGNFIVGRQRGIRMDTQDLVETQRRVLVASLRMGMTQISTVNGMGVSALRWT